MLLTAERLTKVYRVPGEVFWQPARRLEAVKEVCLGIREGETLGIVGASGCGKTTLAHLLCHIITPTSGRIAYGPAIVNPGRDIQLISQNPYDAFDPLLSLGQSLEEPLLIHDLGSQRDARLRQALADVRLDPDILARRPHALSGGQRQRAALARALACEPKLLVCDEPTSALDLCVQAGILNNLTELKDRRGLALIFISHDLDVIRHVSDRICVMSSGIIVEEGRARDVLSRPRHPVTRALIDGALRP